MATLTFILGLCGSGKSCLGEQMARDSGARLFDERFIVTPRHAASLGYGTMRRMVRRTWENSLGFGNVRWNTLGNVLISHATIDLGRS